MPPSRPSLKQQWRSRLLAARHSLSPADRTLFSQKISAHLVAYLTSRSDIQNLCVYIPIRKEPRWDLSTLPPALLPRLYAPRVCTPTDMRFFHLPHSALHNSSLISPDYLAIPAPSCAHPDEADHLITHLQSPSQHTTKTTVLFLIPSVGIIDLTHRIGYGGGYYDHYLSAKVWQNLATSRPHLTVLKLGITYEQCLISSGSSSASALAIPTPDSWDMPIDGALTQQGIAWTQHVT